MLLDSQTGVGVYQFIVDRLEDRRREEYPDGREAYEDNWTAAQDLEKAYAEAVHTDAPDTAGRLFHELMNMADRWPDHPHHPAKHTRDGHQPRNAEPGSRS
ncbi:MULTISPECIES: hypothetical protein [Streptomyces]|uniref:hypothetical protein n=1 Tax=Streptomyces TaxID=1883 RepID=UPI0033C02E67